jgi:translation initiation factor IF-1
MKGGGQGTGDEGRLVPATVREELPSAVYRVELEGRQQVLAHVVGTVKRNFVRLLPGDRVEVELTPHDWTRGRITRKITGTERT